ncbi:hypothetical protein MDA_GLEAN10009965 [Myotis davidii]|uniref:Uncharacterized protein n=1 Tax=Myotis davidii TaxID=225400 RepID=L5LNL6_MYODS|nr:hypothetical protein MDA_GLEAN10009965 [Myotis davidii]
MASIGEFSPQALHPLTGRQGQLGGEAARVAQWPPLTESHGVEVKPPQALRSWPGTFHAKSSSKGPRPCTPKTPEASAPVRHIQGHIQGLVSPRPKSKSIEAVSPSYISTLIHVTFVSIRI